jgi:hypothetical protein
LENEKQQEGENETNHGILDIFRIPFLSSGCRISGQKEHGSRS